MNTTGREWLCFWSGKQWYDYDRQKWLSFQAICLSACQYYSLEGYSTRQAAIIAKLMSSNYVLPYIVTQAASQEPTGTDRKEVRAKAMTMPHIKSGCTAALTLLLKSLRCRRGCTSWSHRHQITHGVAGQGHNSTRRYISDTMEIL